MQISKTTRKLTHHLFMILVSSLLYNFSFAHQNSSDPTKSKPQLSEETPQRNPGETFESALQRYLDNAEKNDQILSRAIKKTAIGSAKSYRSGVDDSNIPEWPHSIEKLQEAFELVRDDRRYFEEVRPNFARRATWLYPEDGCYARAAHSARSLTDHGFQSPGQVFAFGRLRIKTPFKRRGKVYWWYHVAAGYRLNNKVYVLDPSVDWHRPLPLYTWLNKISRTPLDTKVSLCESRTYAPRFFCSGSKGVSNSTAERHLKRLLPLEWKQLKKMGFSPTRLLGDEPPWSESMLPENEINHDSEHDSSQIKPAQSNR
jgi:hypothetical protein